MAKASPAVDGLPLNQQRRPPVTTLPTHTDASRRSLYSMVAWAEAEMQAQVETNSCFCGVKACIDHRNMFLSRSSQSALKFGKLDVHGETIYLIAFHTLWIAVMFNAR